MTVDVYYRVREMERALTTIKDLTDDPRIKNLVDLAMSSEFKDLNKINAATRLATVSVEDLQAGLKSIDAFLAFQSTGNIADRYREGRVDLVEELKIRGGE